MGKRTLDNCRLVRKFGRPVQYDGVCEGFGRSDYDDEPCDKCKECPLHYLNVESEESDVRGTDERCERES